MAEDTPDIPSYRGRFAPSPTGALHFGSLIAALASYADARAHQGAWILRMEDLDRPRERPGAAERILETLRAFGFAWDEPILYQSARTSAYNEALARLTQLGLAYPCGCTRSEIATIATLGAEGPIYPGTCRKGLAQGRAQRSIRLNTHGARIDFEDRIQGPQSQSIEEATGDFVLHRADGIHAYQLAVVVDDAYQGITHVVRGADLLLSTPRQILLQRLLGCSRPTYGHVPLILDEQGHKLSKSHSAAPVDPSNPLPALNLAWRLLGQPPLPDHDSPQAFWDLAIPRWRLEDIPSRGAITIT
ncbi:Glutamyl-Q tRNA(Asp) synthetase [Thiorhodococcus drewsii AZ1]|uniref:Glutamyl-Q tRNA(Asp) synthetase n=1 Tax=Thiorhodococcus drewsii AZ1 TaxID=765913 RepID=G2E2W4_9GAMM|nr:tRNA glutamyl-Q(34) synthetase GluQRS [Thiorhodococcus drewsii]EGV30668.1 Glutamyl-Q tRNA(Asp) synthetase [Thiorhodococcus drewsii AZ1]